MHRQKYLQNKHNDERHEALTKQNTRTLKKNKLTIKKYSRNLKRYFKDIAVTLTNNFIRHNQKCLKRIVRGILKAFA